MQEYELSLKKKVQKNNVIVPGKRTKKKHHHHIRPKQIENLKLNPKYVIMNSQLSRVQGWSYLKKAKPYVNHTKRAHLVHSHLK